MLPDIIPDYRLPVPSANSRKKSAVSKDRMSGFTAHSMGRPVSSNQQAKPKRMPRTGTESDIINKNYNPEVIFGP
jgi:hypothetical protein